MFKCFPIQSKEEQREICARIGAEFRIDDLAYRVWITSIRRYWTESRSL